MAKHSAANTRIKREYFQYLREANRRDDVSIDAVAKALSRFEESNGHKDFKTFHREQAVAFKRKLDEAVAVRSGERLARATVHSTLSALRAFFIWLAGQPGYKSKLHYGDADYFNPHSFRHTLVMHGERVCSHPNNSRHGRKTLGMMMC